MGDLLAEAEAELYTADPDGFTARRTELAGRARDAGEPAVAKKITALRKPTRSAWVVNRLVRSDPEVRSRLDSLAADLRDASDGSRLRELTAARAKLVDELTRTALEGLPAPPAAMREEVTATLDAAIADPEVAGRLGSLARAEKYAGFGTMNFAVAPPAPAPADPAAPPAQTWTPVEAPVWKPGEVQPPEPRGTGYAIDAPKKIDPVPPIAAAAPIAPERQTSPPIARKPTVPRPPRTGGLGPTERPAWLVPAAVAAVVIVLIGIFGVVVLPRLGGGTNPVASTTPSTHPGGSPKASPTSSPTGKTVQTVPTFAPASAAPVSKIQICTADAPCAIPGGSPESGSACDLTSCRVEVAIYFTAVQKSAPVAYTMKFFDRCTGQTTDLPGTKTTTPATGWIVAIPTDHLAVVIPGGVKSGALVAVTSAPAVAASAPLLLGADSC